MQGRKQITTAFFVAESGEKEKPVVIWKSMPKEICYSQKKAWMDTKIMESSLLTKLNY